MCARWASISSKLVPQEENRHRLRAHRAQRDRGNRRVRPGRAVHPPRHAIDSVGAKRVVLDTIEALFAGLPNEPILRAELRRLFRWLKDKGVTAIITGERGDGTLTRHGLEEYVSDCVIVLDHRVADQISTRRLRVVKYRGSIHGTNEYPFLIDETGISVLPITSTGPDTRVQQPAHLHRRPAAGRDARRQGLLSGAAASW